MVFYFKRCALVIHVFFFFNDTATTEIYTLSLHDALPISQRAGPQSLAQYLAVECAGRLPVLPGAVRGRSEEHTSELQSRLHLVCRLLLEKKKKLRTRLSTAHARLNSWSSCPRTTPTARDV